MKKLVTSPGILRVSAVGIVAFKDGKILLVKHEEGSGNINGVYGLPAGHLDKGETLLEAAVREFSEETGLIAKPENFSEFEGNIFYAEILRKNGKIEGFDWTVFIVSEFKGEIRDGDDEVTPQWVSIEELNEIEKEGKLLPNVKEAVMAVKKI